MKTEIKNAVEAYQCPGCTSGHNIECFQKNEEGLGCGRHSAGTFMSSVGRIFLGLSTGFNRIGPQEKLIPTIFDKIDESCGYDKFNIPTWKYLNKSGHTIVRGMMPRRNQTFIHIYLENCIDKIQCLEITESDIKDMD